MSAQDILRASGLRPTAQRIALFTYLADERMPRSICDIIARLKTQMDAVTVYRIIESFQNAGIVRQVDLRQGSPLFELIDEHDHHHIVCTKCERVEDFEGCNYESLTKTALKQSSAFASIQSHSIELFGVCKKCTH